MKRRDLHSPVDGGPDARLRAALDALPEERTPPVHSWAQLQRAIAREPDSHSAQRRPTPRTRVRWAGLAAIAATLVVVLGVVSARSIHRAPADPLAGLSAEERRDPRVLALVAQTESWHAAANDSVRSARWPREARLAVDGAIESTNRALVSARGVLARDPSDDGARAAIEKLREQQRALLQHAMTLLDDI